MRLAPIFARKTAAGHVMVLQVRSRTDFKELIYRQHPVSAIRNALHDSPVPPLTQPLAWGARHACTCLMAGIVRRSASAAVCPAAASNANDLRVSHCQSWCCAVILQSHAKLVTLHWKAGFANE